MAFQFKATAWANIHYLQQSCQCVDAQVLIYPTNDTNEMRSLSTSQANLRCATHALAVAKLSKYQNIFLVPWNEWCQKLTKCECQNTK